MLELVGCETLAHELTGPAVRAPDCRWTSALDLARQIAEALEAAHEKGAVHRDLKPANIAGHPRRPCEGDGLRLAKALDPLNWFEDLEQRVPCQMKCRLQIADSIEKSICKLKSAIYN